MASGNPAMDIVNEKYARRCPCITKEAEMAKVAKSTERWVVVTTDKDRRGVFGGILESHDGDMVVLRDAQMAVYWSAETRGVAGLASIGPQAGSRISPPASRMEINGVIAVIDASAEARKAWEAQPWE